MDLNGGSRYFFGSILISVLLLQVRLSNVADNPVKPDAPQTMLLNMNGADGDVECRLAFDYSIN